MNLDNDCCLETISDAFRIGSRTERERIIKLLDDECKISVPTDWHPNHCTCQTFIALIKGENTDKSTVRTSADNAITDTQGENK